MDVIQQPAVADDPAVNKDYYCGCVQGTWGLVALEMVPSKTRLQPLTVSCSSGNNTPVCFQLHMKSLCDNTVIICDE